MPGAWDAGGTRHRFHLRLVADVRAVCGSIPSIPSLCRATASGSCSLLQRPHQALDGAELPGQPHDRGHDLVGIERIVDAPVPASSSPSPAEADRQAST